LQVFLAAGAESLHAPESDPKMRSYLTWLKVEDDKAPAAAPGATVSTVSVPAAAKPAAAAVPAVRPPVPAAQPPKLPKPARPPGAADEPRQGSAKKRHKKKHRSKASLPPLPPTAAAPAPVINVELVPLPAPGKAGPQSLWRAPYSARDFSLFGAGIGITLLAILLGFLVFLVVPRRPAPALPPPPATSPQESAPAQ
jgi:hypothetical protein